MAARLWPDSDECPCHVRLMNSGVEGWIINLKQGANDQTAVIYKVQSLQIKPLPP